MECSLSSRPWPSASPLMMTRNIPCFMFPLYPMLLFYCSFLSIVPFIRLDQRRAASARPFTIPLCPCLFSHSVELWLLVLTHAACAPSFVSQCPVIILTHMVQHVLHAVHSPYAPLFHLHHYTPLLLLDHPCYHCQGHSAPRRLQRGSSYPRTSISPEWVVLVKLYAMKALWPYRYECRGGLRRVDYNQQMMNR
jgi:hypothetical protein